MSDDSIESEKVNVYLLDKQTDLAEKNSVESKFVVADENNILIYPLRRRIHYLAGWRIVYEPETEKTFCKVCDQSMVYEPGTLVETFIATQIKQCQSFPMDKYLEEFEVIPERILSTFQMPKQDYSRIRQSYDGLSEEFYSKCVEIRQEAQIKIDEFKKKLDSEAENKIAELGSEPDLEQMLVDAIDPEEM